MKALFFVCASQEWSLSQEFLAESVEPVDRNGGVTKAMQTKHRKYYAKDVEIFRNNFFGLKALITLEQVITSVVEKKNLTERNVDGELVGCWKLSLYANEAYDAHEIHFRRWLKRRALFITFLM